MEYLHLHYMVHFDLKCDNLLCDLRDLNKPVVKIGDLGLSKTKKGSFISGNMRGTLPWWVNAKESRLLLCISCRRPLHVLGCLCTQLAPHCQAVMCPVLQQLH